VPLDCFADKKGAAAIRLIAAPQEPPEKIAARLPKPMAAWFAASGFKAKPGSVLLLPGADGEAVGGALVGVEGDDDMWSWGGAAAALPPGRYYLDPGLKGPQATRVALGWALGSYRFSRYKSGVRAAPQLVWPSGADRAAATAAADATWLARDLINTPAADMGPEELTEAASALAKQFKAKHAVIVGDGLLERNLPAIHAVGRAADRAPRLIDLAWGDKSAPKVTLVGKGVCFDTGGLDLKSGRAMGLMKKDMGGGAVALGLAHMIMAAGLKVRLRVLIPAVENSVSGNAMRPRDVLRTRKGLTVEVGNTDAEGRLVLADALALATEENPALLIDFATLTGAARSAVGTEIAALFTPDDALADALCRHGVAEADPVWRLPLWRPYRRLIDSPVADINNSGDSPYAGAITAALFLSEFVGKGVPWAHFDIMAWNVGTRPGRPEGGEAMAMRAAFAAIRERLNLQ